MDMIENTVLNRRSARQRSSSGTARGSGLPPYLRLKPKLLQGDYMGDYRGDYWGD